MCLSFTGTAHAMEVFQNQEKLHRSPSVETCIQWEMKIGLYKLTRPKEPADDWIWIADHVVNKGNHKCLVILGVRMSFLEKDDFTLSLDQVEPLGIVPMKVSNGGLIQAELEMIMKANHDIAPLAIIKDQGSDLRCGGKLFCETHPNVINIDDVPHKIACLYKHLLKNDETWGKFTQECASFKKQIQLIEYSTLAPPNQRSKARYHNIDVLIDWGSNYLEQYDKRSYMEKQKLLEAIGEYWKDN